MNDFEVYSVMSLKELKSSKESWTLMASVDIRIYGCISAKVVKNLYHIEMALEVLEDDN